MSRADGAQDRSSDPAADLIARDRLRLWHPFTQHGIEDDPLPVVAARDAELVLSDGRVLIDAIASWWSCLHGHGRRELVDAIAAQAGLLDHVLFAGSTHPGAVALAERLLAVAPAGLARVFFSDNGSTAVEVALKMALQAQAQRGHARRTRFLAFDGSYHGDTVGAMSVGDPDPYFEPYRPLLFDVHRVPLDARAVEQAFATHGAGLAGVILEPLVQGAGGMLMHDEAFVHMVREGCTRHGAYFIADEVMTGFGRTGALFACGRAGVRPDLLCVAKGLSGGILPLAATLATEEIFGAFVADDRRKALFHGHTFTANPIACAAALASLDIVEREDTPARLDALGARIERSLRSRAVANDPTRVRELRRRGGIVALELASRSGDAPGYLAGRALELRRAAVGMGVLLRPLGDVLYAMPPSCMTEAQCDRTAEVMAALAEFPGPR